MGYLYVTASVDDDNIPIATKEDLQRFLEKPCRYCSDRSRAGLVYVGSAAHRRCFERVEWAEERAEAVEAAQLRILDDILFDRHLADIECGRVRYDEQAMVFDHQFFEGLRQEVSDEVRS